MKCKLCSGHMTPHDDRPYVHVGCLEHKLAALQSEVERLRAALETIAHDHAQHAYLFSECNNKPADDPIAAIIRGAMSVTLGWAQGIAREALGQPQNEWTQHFAGVLEKAWGHLEALRAALPREGEGGSSNG